MHNGFAAATAVGDVWFTSPEVKLLVVAVALSFLIGIPLLLISRHRGFVWRFLGFLFVTAAIPISFLAHTYLSDAAQVNAEATSAVLAERFGAEIDTGWLSSELYRKNSAPFYVGPTLVWLPDGGKTCDIAYRDTTPDSAALICGGVEIEPIA